MSRRASQTTAVPEVQQETSGGRTPRKSAADRKQHILSVAAELFAEQGFQATTRDLSSRLGLTQAALYKHFKSKDEIIAALFDASAERWRTENWGPLISDNSVPLDRRLAAQYGAYLSRMTGQGMRLFVRAGLDGLRQPGRRGAMLTASILQPIIEAVRADVGLPPCSVKALVHGEREVAMALHGSLMFLGIRKHVYRMEMPDDLSPLVDLHVRLWLPGAREEIVRLHGSDNQPQQLVPTRRQKR